VFIGTVLWSDNIERKACVVFTQFGNTIDWKRAKSNKEIIFKQVTHFLFEDYKQINEAIQELIDKYP
jgi:alpha/beta superfamily hydrolase